MQISVFGLGYVGCVSAACLAHDGHQVIGVDVNPYKVELVRSGQSPIIEAGLDTYLKEGVESGRLSATTSVEEAIANSEISLICVGTPSNKNGSLKLDYVEKVCQEIGTVLATKDSYHVVVIRSTVLPGTVRERMLPILEASSGKKAGEGFGLSMNPEFLRESSAIQDYYNPALIAIGEYDERSGACVERIYEAVDAPVRRVTLEVAEALKYANNAFHALKVAFANEIGSISRMHGIDGREVMELFCMDHTLNISKTYLRPGFAFGGSCLPKDVRALTYHARDLDVVSPLLNAVMDSNQQHIQRAIDMVESTGCKKIGVLGLSFKAGTDDVRESPIVPVVETLVGRGYTLSIFDEQLELSKLIGQNKAFLEQEIPHIAQLMRPTMEAVIAESEVIVVANGSKQFKKVLEMTRDGQIVIDLDGVVQNGAAPEGAYHGICW